MTDEVPVPRPTPRALSAQAQRWAGVGLRFFSAHVILQAATVSAGLLFANLLPVDEFALYTVATSILTMFAFATDMGSSSALLHFFHQGQQGGTPYAVMAQVILRLRRSLYLLGAPLMLAGLWWWGRTSDRTTPELGMLAGVILVTVWWQVLGTTRLVDLRLHGRYPESYRAEVTGALARLAVAAAIVGAGMRNATAAMATALVAALVTAWVARGAFGGREAGVATAGASRRTVLRYLAPTLPNSVYYVIQGQFVVWFAAIFGSVTNVAQVGALARLGLIVGAFGGLSQVVFLPRLARLTDERLFARRVVQFGGILCVVALTLLGAALMAPGAFLMVLGPSYEGLAYELHLMILASGLGLLGGFLVAVNNARSWSRWQPGALTLLIASQAGLALMVPLNTTSGVLWFAVGSASVGLAAQLVITIAGVRRPAWVKW